MARIKNPPYLKTLASGSDQVKVTARNACGLINRASKVAITVSLNGTHACPAFDVIDCPKTVAKAAIKRAQKRCPVVTVSDWFGTLVIG